MSTKPLLSSTDSCCIPRLSIMLRILAFSAVPIHGDMSQSQRLGALSKFKSGSRKILVATDVASRFVNFPYNSQLFTDIIAV